MSQPHTTQSLPHTTQSHTILLPTHTMLPHTTLPHTTLPPMPLPTMPLPTTHTRSQSMAHQSALRTTLSHGAWRTLSTQPTRSSRPSNTTTTLSSKCTRTS